MPPAPIETTLPALELPPVLECEVQPEGLFSAAVGAAGLDRSSATSLWPAQTACRAEDIGQRFQAHLLKGAPVAHLILESARLLDAKVEGPPTKISDFDAALRALCTGSCPPPRGALSAEARALLTPVLWTIVRAAEARDARENERGPFWNRFGGLGLLPGAPEQRYNAAFQSDRDYLLGGRDALYRAASQLSAAIERVTEQAGWRALLSSAPFEQETPLGWIVIKGESDDRYEASGRAYLLVIDLGGDDVYLDELASNRSWENAVSVLIDVAGNDRYSYPEAEMMPLGGLPEDSDGRSLEADRFQGASVSLSARQGGARDGIAMLFDLGGDDHYIALRMSQGYAHQGVGVLFDGEGDDLYQAEAGAQGAGQYGLGLAIDLGFGDDQRIAQYAAQGHGFVQGLGLLLDDGGADTYRCSAQSVRYEAPQLPGEANTSFCQGAGYGFFSERPEHSLKGGIGAIIDLGGDDHYESAVFGQGVGYWHGFGLLYDQQGADLYQGLWYTQGAGVHRGVGALIDAGEGADTFSATAHASMGLGHDLALGMLLNLGDDEDRYDAPTLSLGAASCGGLGVFADAAGLDTYNMSARSAGAAVSAQCAQDAQDVLTVGIALDALDRSAELFGAPGAERGDPVRVELGPNTAGVGVDTDDLSGLCFGSRCVQRPPDEN